MNKLLYQYVLIIISKGKRNNKVNEYILFINFLAVALLQDIKNNFFIWLMLTDNRHAP